MATFKPDLKITIVIDNKSFSISGLKLPNGKYLIKRGRSKSVKMPVATLTQIFDLSRKWAVKNIQQ
jgi:hypothetical protein